MPLRGPEASQRTSFAIFMSEPASVRSAPEANASASCAASASNLFGAETKGWPVISATRFATRTAYSGCVLSPVPTAVPPIASSRRWGSACLTCSIPWSSCDTQPEISWPSVSGTASCRCVRPILTMSANSFALPSRTSRSFFTSGRSRSSISETAAMCIAVGNVSFEDCDLFTSSFGWMGFFEPSTPPAISIARFEMTSFTFMFVCVPLPVWKTTRGKCASSFPSMTSCAAAAMSFVFSASRSPSSRFTSAAAFLRMPNARIIGRPNRISPISKFWSERCVWAPQ